MSDDRILIVDDDKNMLEVLSLRLETEGYNVTASTGAGEAFNHVKDKLFDLALVDLRLGDDESGIELMKRFHQVSPEMPVIILTAHGTIDTAVEAMKLGAYSFLTKPFNRRELLLQIKNGLEKSSCQGRFAGSRIWLKNDTASKISSVKAKGCMRSWSRLQGPLKQIPMFASAGERHRKRAYR
jgi:DNA-binding NtrC family response regulator